MTIDARQLLRRLEPAVRPAGPGTPEVEASSLERARFDELLARAESGEFSSGLELDTSELEEPIDDDLRERIDRIADAAEASGHGSILVIAGDRALLVDVPGRRFEGELLEAVEDSSATERLHAIDAAVRLRTEERTVAPTSPTIHVVPPAIADAILAGTADTHSNQQETAPDPRLDTRDDAA